VHDNEPVFCPETHSEAPRTNSETEITTPKGSTKGDGCGGGGGLKTAYLVGNPVQQIQQILELTVDSNFALVHQARGKRKSYVT
jgi:hypothetical protein